MARFRFLQWRWNFFRWSEKKAKTAFKKNGTIASSKGSYDTFKAIGFKCFCWIRLNGVKLNSSFYQTKEWIAERKEILKDWNGLCERCGSRPISSPQVHHLFGVDSTEVKVLCPKCHMKIHGIEKEIKKNEHRIKCRFCGQEIQWGLCEGRWRPLRKDFMGFHECSKKGNW